MDIWRVEIFGSKEEPYLDTRVSFVINEVVVLYLPVLVFFRLN